MKSSRLNFLKKKVNRVREYSLWLMTDRKGPPPHFVKQRVLKEYAEKYGLLYFVETGTHSGATVNAMRGSFEKIYSIELSKKFYRSAHDWFKNDESISIIHGDSGVELEGVVEQLTGAALFWLDGHYSAGATARGKKDTPVMQELEHIYEKKEFRHVVIIDDARAFGVDPAYPTITEIESLLRSKNVEFELSLKFDAIRILPI